MAFSPLRPVFFLVLSAALTLRAGEAEASPIKPIQQIFRASETAELESEIGLVFSLGSAKFRSADLIEDTSGHAFSLVARAKLTDQIGVGVNIPFISRGLEGAGLIAGADDEYSFGNIDLSGKISLADEGPLKISFVHHSILPSSTVGGPDNVYVTRNGLALTTSAGPLTLGAHGGFLYQPTDSSELGLIFDAFLGLDIFPFVTPQISLQGGAPFEGGDVQVAIVPGVQVVLMDLLRLEIGARFELADPSLEAAASAFGSNTEAALVANAFLQF